MMEPQFLIDLSMREYESLRAEVLVTVERQYSLAQWSVSAIAVIAAAVVGGWQAIVATTGLLSVVLLLILPGLTTVYVVTWSHTITKIHQLGNRLHEIEENIARAIGGHAVREAFNVPADSDLALYHYTVGWEHRLWKGNVNLRVETTVFAVTTGLAAMYFSVVALNALLMMNYQNQLPALVIQLTGGAILIWTSVLFFIFRYIRARHRS